jgi:Tol biopolymer transport system component
MAIAPGTRVGTYEVTGSIGAGSMGEVYRARDLRLDREVAIKVLPDSLSGQPELLSRFEREARILARLPHPNIATVFGLEDCGDRHALVMEFVDGPTLADRLSAGPLILDDALLLACQIARALEAAHDRGIVHRDLKPSNVKLMTNGVVKVLDFGVAKALDRDFARESGLEAVSTLPVRWEQTETGIILGTPSYMPPEQARGNPVDHRADIWAFGCVLFEMLSGRRAFQGKTKTDTLVHVIERDPDWTALPATTPLYVRRVLRRCLEKDAARRLHHVADARLELESGAEPAYAATGPQATVIARTVPWAIAAASTILAMWLFVKAPTIPTGDPAAPMHLHLQTPPSVEALPALAGGFAVSPDGRTITQIGVREGVRALFAWDITRGSVREITAANPATAVTFSPDGNSIAYLSANNFLGTFSLQEAVSRTLVTDVELIGGIAWCGEGIVFARNATLWTISPQGGEPRQLTSLNDQRGEILHGAPVCVPEAKSVLFSSLTPEKGGEQVEAVSFAGDNRAVVLERATLAAWSPTGHLIFMRDGAVMALPFDPATGRTIGTPAPVLPSRSTAPNVFGSAALALSRSGTLVYVPGDFAFRRIVGVGRDGSASLIDAPPGRYFNPRVSPDGRRIAIDEDQSTLAIVDLTRNTKTAAGAPAAGTNYPAWNADGSRLVYRRFNRPFWSPADGRGAGGPLPDTNFADFPISAGPDADSMLVVRISAETAGDIYLVSISGAFKPRPLVTTRGYDGSPQLSPDRRWLLYQSSESGVGEVFVSPFPGLDRRWQVSAGGGIQTRWSRTGREIFFRNGSRLIAVSVDLTGREPVFGKPTVLFDQVYDYGHGVSAPDYDVMADGRFVMIRPEPGANRLEIVVNWIEELKDLLAIRR